MPSGICATIRMSSIKKSAAAAARVRSQTAMTIVMPQELDVLSRGVVMGSDRVPMSFDALGAAALSTT